MHDFYTAEFVIRSKKGSAQDSLGTLVDYVLTWLKKRYGKDEITRIIPNRDRLLGNGSLDSSLNSGKIFIDTAYCENSNGIFWACKIIELFLRRASFAPRKWITEIGYQSTLKNETSISYSVKFDDALTTEKKPAPFPEPNAPEVATLILKSDKWTCSVKDGFINKARHSDHGGTLFGLEACRRLIKKTHSNSSAETNNHWISLCKVNRPDKNKDIWMQRLADVVDGVLVAPSFDDAKEKIFDNRPLIFCNDGPNDPDNIGFWEWTERQSQTGRWFSNATYIEHPTPIEIIILNQFSNVGEIMGALKSGLPIPAYARNNILFAVKNDAVVKGVLCNLSNFNVRLGNDNDVFITIKDNIYELPYYEFSEQDVFTWNYRKIYKRIALTEPKKQLPVYAPAETIKQLFLQRMSWPVFKAQGISKSDWQKFKQFMSEIPNASILESLSEMYDLSHQEAEKYVDSFLQTVENYIDTKDVDSTLIVQMLENHKGLKQVCDEVSYKGWLAEHEAEIAKAKKEVAAIQSEAEQKVVAAKQHLLDIENSVSSAEAKKQTVLSEITTAQSKLEQLRTEIEQYEALGNDALTAVRQKISDAQKDMAGFIADLSVFLPQSSLSPNSKQQVSGWRYTHYFSLYLEEEIEFSETWEDEISIISDNLQCSAKVENELCLMLTAFVYAAHINNIPLLIAGPGGYDIANVLSASIYASPAGQLTLCNECSYSNITEVSKYDEHIIAVQNMFGKGWSDILPQAFSTLNKHIIWTHPYAEDLAIEPKGLYNYMLPILSECFVGIANFQVTLPTPGKRVDGFKAYPHKRKQPLRMAAFKRLGLSKLLTQQLELVLTDTKAIIGSSKDKDIEVLFGLIPLCVLTGRVDVLSEAIETEKGISNSIKAEAARYIEEE